MKKMKIDNSEAGALVLHNVNSDTYFLGTEDEIKTHVQKVGSLKAFSEELVKRFLKGSADYEIENGEVRFHRL